MRKRTLNDWRRAVYRASYLSGNVQVLLLKLSEHMNAERRVSVPREVLAAELNLAPQRVSERIATAIEKGWLDRTAPGYRGHTAEFQGMFGERDKGSGSLGRNPSRIPGPFPDDRSRSDDSESVRDLQDAISTAEPSRSAEAEPCQWHKHGDCAADCPNHVTGAKRSTA